MMLLMLAHTGSFGVSAELSHLPRASSGWIGIECLMKLKVGICTPLEQLYGEALTADFQGIDLAAAVALGVRELWPDGPLLCSDLAEMESVE